MSRRDFLVVQGSKYSPEDEYIDPYEIPHQYPPILPQIPARQSTFLAAHNQVRLKSSVRALFVYIHMCTPDNGLMIFWMKTSSNFIQNVIQLHSKCHPILFKMSSNFIHSEASVTGDCFINATD